MVATPFYCRQCNQRINASGEAAACPRCGHTLSAWKDQVTLEADGRDRQAAEWGGGEADELVGSRLATYWIERFLGQGGMARVYRAKHLTLERPCAIKVMQASLASEPQAVDKFMAEARAAAALVHPHVVTLHTIGEDRQRHYIEMEYVDGQSLARLLDASGPLDVTLATRFMVQISSALAAAHQMGMVHRDIKPANVMVTRDGVAKLADFGLAKRVGGALGAERTAVIAGTPHYMAPELFQGQMADTRSDVYAMGVTYFSLLTGQLPIEANSLSELIRLHVRPAELRLDALAPAGDGPRRVIERCLAYHANQRYRDAAELCEEFRALYGSLRSLGSLLRESLTGVQATIEGGGDQFTVTVPLPGGRSQKVHVATCRGSNVSEELVRIYSVCAPIRECYFRRALELNADICHGAIAIQDVDGRPHFVMSDAYPRATCDPHEVRQSVLTIARHADRVEQLLTGSDRQ